MRKPMPGRGQHLLAIWYACGVSEQRWQLLADVELRLVEVPEIPPQAGLLLPVEVDPHRVSIVQRRGEFIGGNGEHQIVQASVRRATLPERLAPNVQLDDGVADGELSSAVQLHIDCAGW